MKITRAQREYYRYTGVSAEVERRGRGSNNHDFTRLPKKAVTSNQTADAEKKKTGQ